jgi:hypothetical protein
VYIAMKRRELEDALRRLGRRLLRHRDRHDVWTDGEREEAIPRHAEIHEHLARAILKRARERNWACDFAVDSAEKASSG